MTRKIFISLLFVFCVFIDELFAMKVYPNPWIPEDKSGRQGTLAGGITFDELSNTGGEIYIYNVVGELVRRLRWESGVSLNWDGKNDRGEDVASGVYVGVLKAGGKTSKIVIIR